MLATHVETLAGLFKIDDREVERVSRELGVSPADLSAHPEVQRRISAAVQRANAKLARFEQIKRHALLPKDFSLEEDTLTATLKIKRRNVAAKYSDHIERLYAEANEAYKAHAGTRA